MTKLNMIKKVSRRSCVSGVGAHSLSPLASLVSSRVKAGTELANDMNNAPARDSRDGYVPVVTPGIAKLPYEMVSGVKVFKLRAEPVTTKFQDMSDPHGMARRPIHGWGYNG